MLARICAVILLASIFVPRALLAASGSWKQLFDGKDLTGWKHVGPGFMTVEEGLIETHGGMGLLYWAGGKLGNCVIRVVYKMRDQNDNSGVFIRIPIEPREEWMPVHYGYEVQIDNHPEDSGEDEFHATGTLYSLTKALARPGEARAGMEQYGNHARWPEDHRSSQRCQSDRLHRGRAGAGEEVQV